MKLYKQGGAHNEDNSIITGCQLKSKITAVGYLTDCWPLLATNGIQQQRDDNLQLAKRHCCHLIPHGRPSSSHQAENRTFSRTQDISISI